MSNHDQGINNLVVPYLDIPESAKRFISDLVTHQGESVVGAARKYQAYIDSHLEGTVGHQPSGKRVREMSDDYEQYLLENNPYQDPAYRSAFDDVGMNVDDVALPAPVPVPVSKKKRRRRRQDHCSQAAAVYLLLSQNRRKSYGHKYRRYRRKYKALKRKVVRRR